MGVHWQFILRACFIIFVWNEYGERCHCQHQIWLMFSLKILFFLNKPIKNTIQGGSFSIESSPSREILPVDSTIEDLQSRIKKLERWHTIDLVIWTVKFLPSPTIYCKPQYLQHQIRAYKRLIHWNFRFCGPFFCLRSWVILYTKGVAINDKLPTYQRNLHSLIQYFYHLAGALNQRFQGEMMTALDLFLGFDPCRGS